MHRNAAHMASISFSLSLIATSIYLFEKGRENSFSKIWQEDGYKK